MRKLIEFYDKAIIHRFGGNTVFARIAIFIVFFWFGALKVVGTSPANELVLKLLSETMPFLPAAEFVIGFGVFEMIIGILFLIPRIERFTILVLFFHMFTTALPLVLLKDATWQSFLTPTLEGQYIIKNLVIIALALGIAAHSEPNKRKSL